MNPLKHLKRLRKRPRVHRLEKLVRASDIARMETDGSRVRCRHLNAQEFLSRLVDKLDEEVREAEQALARNDQAAILEELADVQQLINTVQDLPESYTDDAVILRLADVQEWLNVTAKLRRVSSAAINAAREAKLGKRGGFHPANYVVDVTCAAGSEWDVYFTKNYTPLPCPERSARWQQLRQSLSNRLRKPTVTGGAVN